MDQTAEDPDASQQQARDRRKAALDAIQKFLDLIRSTNPQLKAASSSAEVRGAARRKAAKPQLIGQATYTVPAHERLRLRIRLQRSATKFLRKWKSLNVGIAVVEPGPTGKLRVKTKIVTLKARTRKK